MFHIITINKLYFYIHYIYVNILPIYKACILSFFLHKIFIIENIIYIYSLYLNTFIIIFPVINIVTKVTFYENKI